MLKREFLAGVIALSQENPKRLLNLIRDGWPEIKAAIDQGHTLKTIHQRLEAGGVRITYRCFTMYVRRLRKEFGTSARQPRKAELITAAAKEENLSPIAPENTRITVLPVEPQPTREPEQASCDPYSTIREHLNRKPPGFHWDEDAPNASKVIES